MMRNKQIGTTNLNQKDAARDLNNPEHARPPALAIFISQRKSETHLTVPTRETYIYFCVRWVNVKESKWPLYSCKSSAALWYGKELMPSTPGAKVTRTGFGKNVFCSLSGDFLCVYIYWIFVSLVEHQSVQYSRMLPSRVEGKFDGKYSNQGNSMRISSKKSFGGFDLNIKEFHKIHLLELKATASGSNLVIYSKT